MRGEERLQHVALRALQRLRRWRLGRTATLALRWVRTSSTADANANANADADADAAGGG